MDPEFDYQKLQKKIGRKQRRKIGLMIGAAVIISFALIISVPPILNQFYYDPRSGNEVTDALSYIDNRQINNELTQPNRYLSNYQITPTGIGSYEVMELYRNYAQEVKETKNYQITRNRIIQMEPNADQDNSRFIFETRLHDSEVWSAGDQELKKKNLLRNVQDLPASTQITTTVLFKHDLTLAEYQQWQTYQAPYAETLWVAVRTETPKEGEHRLPVGFAKPFDMISHSSGFEVKDSNVQKYPYLRRIFPETAAQQKLSEEEKDTLHFKSLLKFLKTQKSFLALEHEYGREILSEQQIDETLAYVDQHGISTYGVMLSLSLSEFQKLLSQNENLLEVRINETQLFNLTRQDSQYADKKYEADQ